MNIIKSSTSMKSKPSENSSFETECLFGEAVEVLDQDLDWVYCKLITDNYCGWVKKSRIAKFREATHRVLNIRTFIYKDADAKSDILLYLPMGANLVVQEINSNWAEICFLINNVIKVGYVPVKHIVNLNHKVSDWVKVAQSLKDSIQMGRKRHCRYRLLSFTSAIISNTGQVISRNTCDQVNLENQIFPNLITLEEDV